MKHKLFALLLVVLVVTACSGAPRTAPPTAIMQVSDVWMFASQIEKTDQSAPLYMTLTNTGSGPGELIGANTTVVTSSDINGSTQMRNGAERVNSIPVPAGGKVEFNPDGYHIRISSLPPALKAGDTFSLNLAFSQGDNRIVTVVVRP